jgi:hypothetical protein
MTVTPGNGLGPSGNDALMSLAQTDAEGAYRLESILPGDYYIVVGPLDAPIYFPGVAARSNGTILVVTAGTNLAASDFRLTKPLSVRVSGRVIRDGHRAGNQVILTRNRQTFNTTIAPDGSFTFPAVQPGIYQVRVTPGVNSLPPVTVVVADSDITGLELTIPLSAVDILVNVTVAEVGGGAVPRLQLQFMPAEPLPTNLSATMPTNFATNGRNILTFGGSTQSAISQQGFPQTEYRVRVNPLPAGYIVKSITVGSLDVMNRPFKISAAEPTNLVITLGADETAPWVTLRGHVTGIAASPVQATSISIQGNGLAGPLQSTVNPDGSFEIPKVLPGTYQVRLTPAADAFNRTIVVDRANPRDIEIPMQIPALKVSGRTTDETQLKRTGELLPDQSLRATLRPEPGENLSGSISNSAVGADGSFTFPAVQAGRYVAYISICHSDVCTSTGGTHITVDRDLDGVFVPLKGDPIPTASQTFQTSTPADVVEGTVTIEGGAPLPRFRVRFVVGAVTRTAAVASKSFTASLPRGDYRVAIDLPAGYEVRSLTDGTSDLGFWPMSVAPSPSGSPRIGAAPRIAITLGVAKPEPWVKVNGRVVGSSAFRGVTVQLTGAILADELTTTSGSDGSFEFPKVLPDTYTLRLLPGGGTFTQTIVVGPSGLSGLEIHSSAFR